MSSLQVYIRHPEEIPIELEQLSRTLPASHSTQGLGLICHSHNMIIEGSAVELRVPFVEPSIRVSGIVNWCRNHGPGFELGIDFDNPDATMRMRMLEQLCQIHQYRLDIRAEQGRTLSPDDAAVEWIQRYAALFPNDGV